MGARALPPLPHLPLNALRAFEATMRLGGRARAAGALGVTPGAVSRQVAALEAQLDQRLFAGPRNAQRPTRAAEALMAEIGPAMVALEAAMEARRPRRRPLAVSCLSTLAARWLIPRLARLEAAAPGVGLDIRESYAPLSSDLDGCDLAIRMWEPDAVPPPGIEANAFMANAVGLVVPVGVVDGRLRRLASRSHPHAWDGWAEAAAWVDDAPPHMFDHQQTMIEAAIAGLGAAIAQRPLVEADLAAGRLTAPLGFRSDGAAFAVFHRREGTRAGVAAVVRWLKAEGAGGA